MTFQRGMLKTLGINLYANIGKVLVEFIANAYDSDAGSISVSLPTDRIAAARQAIKDARARAAVGTTDAEAVDGAVAPPSFDGLMATLSDGIEVVIEDDGHGMTWAEVQDHFLPLNRQRRRDAGGRETRLTSPGGRYVMGRKGVGKLAGFGAAERVVLRTKRRGETYATTITMSDTTLENDESRPQISIPVSYEDGLDPDAQGTRIVLSRLKADAFKASTRSISDTIGTAFFAIREEDFAIRVNDASVRPPPPDYEFAYPPSLTLAEVRAGAMAEDAFDVPDVGTVAFRYHIGFRKRSDHLPAGRRGARIYCNHRLAAGPTLFNLGTGMHSFHSADYMECIVEADQLDRGSVDLISTSRTQFQEGNDVYDALQDKVAGLMKDAIARHGRFRDQVAAEEIERDPKAQIIKRSVDQLPKRTRNAATRLLTTIASQYGVGTPEFEELAPIILNSVNATEVLARLVSTGTKPETVSTILGQLNELSEIELRDVLKLYRGRRGGISKLQALQRQGHDLWKQKGLEKDLHLLLKENPWLIRPEFSTYVTSDERMNTVASKIAQSLGVDRFATIVDGTQVDATRPDLVFVMSDRGSEGPFVIRIVELKSPTLPLTIEHHRQLEDYIGAIERWCRTELKRTVAVNGYLIGEMPDAETKVQAELNLLRKFTDASADPQIRIAGLTQVINDAWNIHVDAIRAIEAELEDDEPDQAASASAREDVPAIAPSTASNAA
jgi:hypothetical protein